MTTETLTTATDTTGTLVLYHHGSHLRETSIARDNGPHTMCNPEYNIRRLTHVAELAPLTFRSPEVSAITEHREGYGGAYSESSALYPITGEEADTLIAAAKTAADQREQQRTAERAKVAELDRREASAHWMRRDPITGEAELTEDC